jgi:MFS family permease
VSLANSDERCFFANPFARGFDAQINGAMISVPAFRRDFGYIFEGEPVLPASWQTAFNMVSSVGQFFGGFMCSWSANKIGRKGALAVGLVLCAGGIFGEIFSKTLVAFLMSKLILGFGLGFYLTIGPMACSEIAPVVSLSMYELNVRHTLTLYLHLCRYFVVYQRLVSTWALLWVNSFRTPLSRVLENGLLDGRMLRPSPSKCSLWRSWPLVSGLCLSRLGILSAKAGTSKHFKPYRSFGVRTLMSTSKCKLSFQGVRRDHWLMLTPYSKLASLKVTIQEEQALKESNLIDCFKGVNLKRSLISTGAFACQHLVGIIFVLGYSTYFFQLAGLPTSRSFDLGVGVTACGVAGNIASW